MFGEKLPKRRWGALAAVCLAVMVIVMDGSIVNVALPTLVQALGGTSNSQLQWIVDAYILSFAVFLLTSGSSADRFGRKKLLLIGLAIFAAVSVGAALSQTPTQLIAWRAFMGIGAALIFPATLAILTDAFPEPNLRRLAIAVWAGSSGLGVAIGPVAGGWLLTHYQWGSIFFINVPLIALAIVGVAVCVRESRDSERCVFDLVGNTLAIAGLFALVWGLIEGPELGWLSWEIIGALATALALLVAFIRWESRTPDPMLELGLFRSRQFSGACLAITTAFFGLFGFVFMVTQFFQFIHGYDALGAGLRTLPFAGFIIIGAAIAAKFGVLLRPRMLASGGLVIMALGFMWVTDVRAETPYLTLVYQMGLLRVGLRLVSASATDVIMASLPTAKAGVGSSVNDTAREIGGTLGVAVMGSLFNALYRQDVTVTLAGAPLPEDALEGLRDSVGVAIGVIEKVDQVAGSFAAQAVRAPVQDAFLHGFHASSLLAGIVALVGGVAVFLILPVETAEIAESRLDQRYSDYDSRPVHGRPVTIAARSSQ